MQKYMFGLLTAIAFCQNAQGMDDLNASQVVPRDIRKIANMHYEQIRAKEMEFLYKAVKDEKLMEHMKAGGALQEFEVKNIIYKILGKYMWGGAIHTFHSQTSGLYDVNQQLLRLKLVKDARVLYYATHKVSLDTNPEKLVLTEDDEAYKQAGNIYDDLALYTTWLIEEYSELIKK